MSIRKAEQSDLKMVRNITVETINEIYPHYYPVGAVEFFIEHHTEENINNDIKHSCVFLCLDNEQNLVGTVTVKKNEICRLFVLPRYQGKGHGRELLEFAEKNIFAKYNMITLSASLPARIIYLNRGYCVTEFNIIKANYSDFLCYDVMIKKV